MNTEEMTLEQKRQTLYDWIRFLEEEALNNLIIEHRKLIKRLQLEKEDLKKQLGLCSVIAGFDIDKMKTIVPYYIVDMGETHCNELKFIIETFLSQNHDFKAKVDELKNLIVANSP